MKQSRIKITGLWKNELPSGDVYYSEKVGAMYYSIFKNDFKKSDSEPEFILYLSQASSITEKKNDKDDI